MTNFRRQAKIKIFPIHLLATFIAFIVLACGDVGTTANTSGDGGSTKPPETNPPTPAPTVTPCPTTGAVAGTWENVTPPYVLIAWPATKGITCFTSRCNKQVCGDWLRSKGGVAAPMWNEAILPCISYTSL